MSRFVQMLVATVAVVAGLFSQASAAVDPNALEIGVDVPGYIGLGIEGLAAIAAVAIGGYFAFLLVKKALSWGRRALS
jgi:hypothetical protein